jgi:hypothetical protein
LKNLTDVDKGISDAKKFKNSIDYMRSKGSDIIDYLKKLNQQNK